MHRMCFVPARMSNLPVQHSIIFTPGTDDEVMHYNRVNLLNHCSLWSWPNVDFSAFHTSQTRVLIVFEFSCCRSCHLQHIYLSSVKCLPLHFYGVVCLSSFTYPCSPHLLNHLIENPAIPDSTNPEGPQNTNKFLLKPFQKLCPHSRPHRYPPSPTSHHSS